MPPSVPSLPPPMSAAARQVLVEARRLHLQQFAAARLLMTPAELWNSIVAHRFVPRAPNASSSSGSGGCDDDADLRAAAAALAEETDCSGEFRLDYEGFRAVADELVLHRARRHHDALFRAGKRTVPLLSTEEERAIFFSHPLLSPRTFMAFPTDADGCVKAVPLFTYVAKKLLLYNLRARLELCASVTPPALRPLAATTGDNGGSGVAAAAVPVCRSSPLSNALTADDVEAFVSQLLPNLRLVRDMPLWMLPYYLCHASQKFFFMLDAAGLGVVTIEALMRSDVFSELLRIYESDEADATVPFRVGATVEIAETKAVEALRRGRGNCGSDDSPDAAVGCASPHAPASPDDEAFVQAVVMNADGDGQDAVYTLTVTGDFVSAAAAALGLGAADPGRPTVVHLPRESLHWCPATTPSVPDEFAALENWFSLPIMHRVYKAYCDLDTDGDGLLDVAAMRKYNGGSFTPLVIERVFELFVRGGVDGKMDFKTFLHFVIATEHPNADASVRYMWRLVDLHGTGTRIDIDVLRVFCKAIAAALLDNGLMVITADSILAEIVDMINPRHHEFVTLEDVRRSGHGGTVLPVILDFRNFYAYDCREQVAAGDSCADPGGQPLQQ